MYIIKWKSKLTDYTGQGIYKFDKIIAQSICDKLNLQNNDIEH